MEENVYLSTQKDISKAASQQENWFKAFSQALAACKFSKVKSHLDSSHCSKFLLAQMKQLFDAEKMFLQMRFHAPQSRLLFFQSSKEPSTATIFQNIKLACKQPTYPPEDSEILTDLISFADCRLAFICFLRTLAQDNSTKSIQDALKKLSSQASAVVSSSALSPIFERLRLEFRSLYHIFEMLTFINNLRYMEALISLQQSFSRLDELDSRTGLAFTWNTSLGPVTGGAAGDSWMRFYLWLRNALSHFVGKFCSYFYPAIGSYLISEGQTSMPNALPGLLARSSYPDFIGRFFTLAKRFSVEMLVLICDPVGDRTIIEPQFKLDLDSPHFVPSGDLHVLMSYWPSDPTNDPHSTVFSAAFSRCQHFILKLLTQHRVREDLITSAEVQSTKTILTSVDSTVFLVCSYGVVARGQKESHIINAVTELAGILRCKGVFQPLKDACLQ